MEVIGKPIVVLDERGEALSDLAPHGKSERARTDGSTQRVEIHQHKKVVQVLWLVVQVLVQREEVVVAAPPTTAPRVSNSPIVSLARLSFLKVFFIDPPVQ
jgi:hypothetical protein